MTPHLPQNARHKQTGRLPVDNAYDDAMPPGARSAAFFDLDKTIIAASSSLAFSKPFRAGGLITRRSMLRSAYAQFVFLVGGADHDQMEKMRQFMSQLVAGWDVATVREIVADTLHNVVDPIVYDEAVELIEEHRLAGREIVIVSASGADVVVPIGELLGADHVVASHLEVVDGRYTGEIDYYAYAEEKARAITALADQRGYDLSGCYAYSDSITDVHMLEVVGHPHAVNPDKELRRICEERDWPTLTFARPVGLKSRMSRVAMPTLTALAIGGALAVGGAIWANARRRRLDA
jgi:HAD superfamily hydrolase (TIGR01490 family)